VYLWKVTDEHQFYFPELLAEYLISKPREEDSYEGIIVIDGVPQVGPERLEKLRGVIKKMYGKFGEIINEHYPLDDKEVTKG
jgi:translation initiation factor 3 subunit B